MRVGWQMGVAKRRPGLPPEPCLASRPLQSAAGVFSPEPAPSDRHLHRKLTSSVLRAELQSCALLGCCAIYCFDASQMAR